MKPSKESILRALSDGRAFARELSAACGGAQIQICVRQTCRGCLGSGLLGGAARPAQVCDLCRGAGHVGVLASENYSPGPVVGERVGDRGAE